MRECGNESSWQLVIAGPDEQGTQEKLKALSEKLKLKVAELRDLSGVCDADILFMGPVHGDEKWALMQRADIFVLPSRSENFGMVVGEALSCGVPVVTTAVGPWGEGGEVLKCESSRVLKCESSKVLKLGEGEVRECANAGMRELEVLKFEPASLGATPSQGSAKVSREDERSLARADWLRGLIVVDTSAEGLAEGLRRMMALSDTERKELGSKGCAWVKSEFSWESVAKQMLEAYNTAHIKA
jgi:glycosyltransferase involved in cell wall biosynthesis